MTTLIKKQRTFYNYNAAVQFAKEVNGMIEIEFLNCGQKNYVVRYYAPEV